MEASGTEYLQTGILCAKMGDAVIGLRHDMYPQFGWHPLGLPLSGTALPCGDADLRWPAAIQRPYRKGKKVKAFFFCTQ